MTDGTPTFPSIRPLETLHNSLSLKHLDEFLQRVTQPQVLKLSSELEMRFNLDSLNAEIERISNNNGNSAASSSAFLNAEAENSNTGGIVSPSSSTAWSGSPSFVSSSGPSSPVWSQHESQFRPAYDFEVESQDAQPLSSKSSSPT